ncbi:MAG: hypothetical protein AB7F31_01695 [Parachlamydiales bacterium]
MDVTHATPLYLDPKLPSEQNVERFFNGAYDVAPFIPDLSQVVKWERATRLLVWGGWASLAAGLFTVAFVKGRRLYGLLAIPVSIGTYWGSCETEEKAYDERKRVNVAKDNAKQSIEESREPIYEGMRKHLVKRRLEIEAKVIEAFNEAKETRGPVPEEVQALGTGEVSDRVPKWRPEVEGHAIKKAYEEHGAEAVRLRSSFLKAYQGAIKHWGEDWKVPDWLEYQNLNKAWEVGPENMKFDLAYYATKIFAPGTDYSCEWTLGESKECCFVLRPPYSWRN